MPTQLSVALRGMRFHTLVGILPHERELPQPLEVDLVAWTSAPPEQPVDYRLLYDAAAEVAGAGHGFLETVAASLADRTLRLPGVERVEVVVRKPHVSLPGLLAGAEVRLERTRDA